MLLLTAAPSELTLSHQRAQGRTVVTVAGELDLVSAASFRAAVREALDAARGQMVVLELGGLTFCDLAGLRSVLALKQRARSCQCNLRLQDERVVRRVATAAGLAGQLDAD